MNSYRRNRLRYRAILHIMHIAIMS